MNRGTLIIAGAGLAGLSAAIEAARLGCAVELIAPAPSEHAQSVMAEGGINAALDTAGENDSPERHAEETLEAGCRLASPAAVERLTAAAPEIIRDLTALGTLFSLDRSGRVIQRNFGGQRFRRTVFSGDDTGRQIMTAMIQECRRHEAAGVIRRHSGLRLAGLLRDGGGRCCGCLAFEELSGRTVRFEGRAVVAATGGLNGLFGDATGSLHNTGEAAARLFAAGVEFANGEFIQYHPTTARIAGKRLLLTEAARGEGGRLFTLRNGRRSYFMEERYPELGNLMPRDVVSREIHLLRQESGGEADVFLDLTGIPRDILSGRLERLTEECRDYLKLDPAESPIPVAPGIHYFMGGIRVDADHESSLPGLYAAGECCCQYHGANRLGGNSLLGALHGGITAARAALAAEPGGAAAESGEEPESAPPVRPVALPAIRRELSAVMNRCLDVVRDGERMRDGLEQLNRLIERLAGGFDPARNAYENGTLLPLCQLGRGILTGALLREESRGAHFRSDFPQRDDARFRKSTVLRRDGERETISFEEPV